LSETSKEPVRNISEFIRFRANLLNELGDTKTSLAILDELEKSYDKSAYNAEEILAFKGDIYSKSNTLDSVMHYYKQAIEVMHDKDTLLKADLCNFTSRYQFPNDAKQIQHMSDMLFDDFPSEAKAQLFSKHLNNLAYHEFSSNHNNLDLSQGNQQLFYSIIEPFLENKDSYAIKNQLITDIENISNHFAWQQFSQSRDIVQLPIIDSLEQVEYKIRQQLVNAKKDRNQRQKDSLEQALDMYQTNIQNTYPTISKFTQNNFEITEFQKQIRPNEIVLKYIFFKRKFVVFQITNEDLTWEFKKWGDTEKAIFSDHLDYLTSAQNNRSLTTELTNILIPQSAFKKEILTIIPDAELYFLPFETLGYKKGFLIEDKTIRYSSHLRFAFLEDNEEQKKPSKVTIFSPTYAKESIEDSTRNSPISLEGAKEEAQLIENLFSSTSFIGNTATKENFVNYKTEGSILHMAMHASVDSDDPNFSHFNFANNEKLYLEELYALKIPTDLAVLSACNTGVGKEDGALTMATLQRAFNYAGTKATIASLWEVPDESTSQIMMSFYKHLKNGETKSTALQLAKLDYLSKTSISKLKHPYYWAGFVLYGSDEPVMPKDYDSTLIWSTIIIMFILIFSLIIYRNRKKSKIA
jgi:CHAT domain-containing protein